MKHVLGILVAACCLMACATTKTKDQRDAEGQQAYRQITDSVDNRSFTVEINYVIPRKLQPRFLTSEYTVRVQGDTIVSFLPYFGVAYRADIANQSRSPLDFKSAITDFRAGWTKKKKMHIRLKTRNNMDYITYGLDIFTNGNVSLDVTPTDRESITFTGRLITDQ